MNFKKKIIKLINKLPYIRGVHQEVTYFKSNSCFPSGHFYSPIILVEDIRKRENEIWHRDEKDGINGINLRTNEQIDLLNVLSAYYKEMPFKSEKQPHIRYQFENGFYSYTDGIILYSMIRHYKPNRIIEIGSGFSSAIMLDTNEFFFNNKINLTFIEPFPERLYSLITETDKKKTVIIQDYVQFVALNIFTKLEAGDILFIDSSHVVKTGSDVQYILSEILPILKSGVLIHFHDVFYPFEYPKEWVLGGYNWNEAYFLKAFLMYNANFKIILFSHYMHRLHKDAFNNMPLSSMNFGGNLWIEKI